MAGLEEIPHDKNETCGELGESIDMDLYAVSLWLVEWSSPGCSGDG